MLQTEYTIEEELAYAKLMEEQDINNARQKEEEENISALQLFESGLSKTDIKLMAAATVESVLIKGNPLLVAEALSAMESYIKEIKADEKFKNYTREETAKYPKGYISPSGAKIECSEVGTQYDFSQCGDVELEICESGLRSAEDSLKRRKEFLKNIPIEGIDVIVPYSGEVIHIYPPSKSSNSSYKVTLSK